MKNKNFIRFTALILFLVFSLNTVLGFACAMGMGLTTSHHDDAATEVSDHVDADGKKHQHHKEANRQHHDKKNTSKKDDCCNDKVIKFQSLDKNLNQNTKTGIEAPVFVAIISTFLAIDGFKIVKTHPPKYKDRFFYPPTPDIRIAIQSFQI